MIIDRKYVLKTEEVAQVVNKRGAVVYGAGADGKKFFELFSTIIDIKFFIDKMRLSLDEAVSKIKNELIIICSRKYCSEMFESLVDKGLLPGIDFYVWDMDYNSYVESMIKHNYKQWSKCEIDYNNVVLVPIEGGHDGTAIVYSYVANYFAEKYHARILGYVRQGGNAFESCIYPSTLDVYKSFGMEDIVSFESNSDRELYIERESEKIFAHIKSMDDWQNIKVDGESYGISIIRDYLRKYELSFEPLSDEFNTCVKAALNTIVTWKEFFKQNTVKTVILWDGAHNESYLRDIALEGNIPTYIIHSLGTQVARKNHNVGCSYKFLKKFYNMLSPEEAKQGIEWAKKNIQRMQEGKKAYVPYRSVKNGDEFVFSLKSKEMQNYGNCDGGIKVMICPHIFNEDEWLNGEQLCGENYLSWLKCVGDLSLQTNYDWYIKLHPNEDARGKRIMDEYTRRYPKIKLLPATISPWDIKSLGIQYILTIAGSVGHEYPLLGIDVVNAGNNPHISFEFNINPKTVDEYKEILLNISDYSALKYNKQIYEFYAIYYLYYKNNDFSYEIQEIFKNINLKSAWGRYEKREDDTEIYKEFEETFSDTWHQKTLEEIGELIRKMDSWDEEKLYKKSEAEIKEILAM